VGQAAVHPRPVPLTSGCRHDAWPQPSTPQLHGWARYPNGRSASPTYSQISMANGSRAGHLNAIHLTLARIAGNWRILPTKATGPQGLDTQAMRHPERVNVGCNVAAQSRAMRGLLSVAMVSVAAAVRIALLDRRGTRSRCQTRRSRVHRRAPIRQVRLPAPHPYRGHQQ
jgi:hypothetical protein